MPEQLATDAATPWVWYAPTLADMPGDAEEWMFGRFLDAGVAIAGVDVGESCGNPEGRRLYTLLHEELAGTRNFSKTPCMLARSRGGLMLLNWAAEHPTSVSGIAGIYPVCDISSYPGFLSASGAYGMTEEQLAACYHEHNPVDRLEGMARARVPIFFIHGDIDVGVPFKENSGELAERYRRLGGEITIEVAVGHGHSMWPGFFQCQGLVDFVIACASGTGPA